MVPYTNMVSVLACKEAVISIPLAHTALVEARKASGCFAS